jgi:YVTN family beta-propeller protein
MLRKIALPVAVAAFAATPAFAGPSGYHLVKSVTLGGDTFWDAITLDAPNHHIFITHGDHVVVVDSRTYKVVGDITGLHSTHQVAVADRFNKGFVTQGGNNTVAVFDAKTLRVTGTIPVGTAPDGIVYDPVTRRAFTLNAGSEDATVIDVASGTVDGTVPLGGKPEFAVADGKGHIYDNIESKSEVAKIDAKTMDVMSRWPLAPCTEPSGIAYDRAHDRVFSACHNQLLAVSNPSSGKVVATVPIGEHPDGAAFDPVTGYVLVPDGEGKLTVIHEDAPDKYMVVENVPTQFGARTIELDPATHRVFTATADLTPDPGKHPPYKMTPGSFRLLVYAR